VSKPDGTEYTQWSIPKLDFYWLCKIHDIAYDDMLAIAEQARVPKEVIHQMFLKYPVEHSDAVAVLDAYSQHVGKTWTIDTVKVPVLPELEKDK
jgi:hypothetical protein